MPVAATSVTFAEAARRLAEACRRQSLIVPSFRSPPGRPGAERTVRRRPEGGAVIAVRVRGRPLEAVVADLVDGVVVANRLEGVEAESVRAVLLAAVQGGSASRAA